MDLDGWNRFAMIAQPAASHSMLQGTPTAIAVIEEDDCTSGGSSRMEKPVSRVNESLAEMLVCLG